MLNLATVRDFRINASAVLRRVERGDRVLVTRNSRPVAVVSRVPENLDLEDFILSSHPYFLRRYRQSRRSAGIPLAEIERQLRDQFRSRRKKTRRPASRKA